MTTTKKHNAFVAEPMGNKPVAALAGIGPIYGQRLIDNGYDKVSYLRFIHCMITTDRPNLGVLILNGN